MVFHIYILLLCSHFIFISTSSDALKLNPGTIHHSAFRKRLLKEVCYYGKLHHSKTVS